jgi:hypothetical protein
MAGFRIGLTHGHLGVGHDRSRTPQLALALFGRQKVNCIIFGHTHIPYCRMEKGIFLFNPGSPTDYSSRPSCGLITLSEEIRGEIIYL